MEVKISLIVLVVIGVFLAACSCAPVVSSEKPTSNPDLVSGIVFF